MLAVPSPAAAQPIAIIGMACLFPKAGSLGMYWGNIKRGVDGIGPIPATHWSPDDYFDADPKKPDHTYARRGGFLEPVAFDPSAYGIAPNALEATDAAQLLGLVVATEALRSAGYAPEVTTWDRSRTSVVLGVTGTLQLVIPLGARLGHPQWRKALADAGVAQDVADDVVARIADTYVPWQEASFPGLLGNVVAGRIANRLDLGGTNCVVDAACASSLSAVHLAALELESGKSSMVVTGGVDAFNDIFMYMCFSKTPALSPTGDARPYDADGDGTCLGEGVGMVVLKRLADAERDGDPIFAVLRGVGTASDGRGKAIYAPDDDGQRRCLEAAYAAAGVSPASIELLEGHGTGTKVGDAIEVTALHRVYGEAPVGQAWCALGSVKSQIGHTKAAAGAAGLIKAALALHHKVLPPTIKLAKPLAQLGDATTPFYFNERPRPWVRRAGQPRRAGVSSFGFGGSNFHVVLEEYGPAKAAVDWDGRTELVAISAATSAALLDRLARYDGLTGDALRLAAGEDRAAFDPAAAQRLAFVFEDGAVDAAGLRARVLEGKPFQTPDGAAYGFGSAVGDLAALFPGQGAQYPGMGRDLACTFPAALTALEAASAAFGGEAYGSRLVDLMIPARAFDDAGRAAHAAALRATDVAQPALGAVELGAWHVLQGFGVAPASAAGHSYGELAALCAAGRLAEDDFMRLSALRGRLMAGTGGDRGSMLAVSAGAEEVQGWLTELGPELVVANKNAPAQVVVAGPTAAIERVAQALADRGVRAVRLPVGAAFHSPLVAAAEAGLAEGLVATVVAAGTFPVYANTTAAVYPAGEAAARALLAGQLARPVEWVAQIEAMYAAGARTFLEVGPGARLSGLVKAILGERPHAVVAIDGSAGKRDGVVDLARALATLAARGHLVDLTGWQGGEAALAPLRAKKVPKMAVPISGANHRTPRPARPPVAPKPVAVAANGVGATNGTNGHKAMTTNETNGSNGHHGTNGAALALAVAVPVTMPVAAPAVVEPEAQAITPAVWQDAVHAAGQTLAAWQRMQEQTAALHRTFLEGQQSAQMAFQQLIEHQRTLLDRAGTVSLAPPALAVLAPAALAAANGAAPAAIPSVAVLPSAPAVAPPSAPSAAPAANPAAAARSVASPPVLGPGAATTPPGVGPQAGQNATQPDTLAALIAVVADKTGYPVETLSPEMALEADLGIDSIKRVEIMSAIADRLPLAPVLRPDQLGTLHTLAEVAAALSPATAGSSASPGTAAPAFLPGGTVTPRSGGTPVGQALPTIEAAVVAVVADKTGYPPETLDLDMALEADLGIDSIKRVEILSTLTERLPGAPVPRPDALGALATLADVIAALSADATALPRIAGPQTGHNPAPETDPAATHGLLVDHPVPTALGEGVLRPAPKVPFGAEIRVVAPADDALAAAIAARLAALGFKASAFDLSAEPSEASINGLVVVAPAGVGPSWEEADEEAIKAAFRHVQQSGTALKSAAERGGAWLATVARLDGAFGCADPAAAYNPAAGALAGLAKTAGLEWPEVVCQALDLHPAWSCEEAAAAFAAELFLDGPAEIGLGPAGRAGLVLEPAGPAPAGPAPLAAGDLVVVTGGARGVTAEVAIALARVYKPTLALLGRTPLPAAEPTWLAAATDEAAVKAALARETSPSPAPRELESRWKAIAAAREVRANLARLEALGATARYVAVDVRDAAAMAGAIAELEATHGPVRGLVHGAGVLADRYILDKTQAQFDGVFDTKIGGLRALLGAVDPAALKTCVLFSSVTARRGRVGQSDYAMANELLNKAGRRLAAAHPGCRVLSVDWGPWDGGMVTPALKKVFAAEGVGVVPLEGGAAWLAEELGRARPGAVELVVLGRPAGSPDPAPTRPVVAAAPTPPAPKLRTAFRRELAVRTHPFLASHVMGGKAVLPAAVIVEWMAQAALHANPGLDFRGLDDFAVLKGVVLEHEPFAVRLDAGPAQLRAGEPVSAVELRSDGREQPHARGTVVLSETPPRSPAGHWSEGWSGGERSGAYLLGIKEAYRTVLFHGPEFRGITQVDTVGPDGIIGRVKAARAPQAWLNAPLRDTWVVDPLALDAAFQLLILWSVETLGAPCLPCRAATYRQYAPFPANGTRVLAKVTEKRTGTAIADVAFLDAEGLLVAELRGAECAFDPSLTEAFKRNQLAGATAPHA